MWVHGEGATRFVNRLGDNAALSARMPQGALVRWAMQPPSVSLQMGSAEICRSIAGAPDGFDISREQGLRYDASLGAQVLMP